MSWWGSHPDPRLPRALCKRLLPVGACRVCVYRFQILGPPRVEVLPMRGATVRHVVEYDCERCGLRWEDDGLTTTRAIVSRLGFDPWHVERT